MSDPGTGADSAGRSERLAPRARRGVLGLVGVLAAYYAVPIGTLPSGVGVAFSVIGLLGGITLLAWAIVRQAQRVVRSGPDDDSARLDGLLLLVVVVLAVFAAGYLALERADSGQFESLSTKTDALYFAVSTLATVGFGDVHATGQLARGLVTLQIVFDLVFVASLVSLVTGQLRSRAAIRQAAARPGSPPDPEAARPLGSSPVSPASPGSPLPAARSGPPPDAEATRPPGPPGASGASDDG